jgi:hypothetical protein
MIPESPESLADSLRAHEAHQKAETERLKMDAERARARAIVDAALLRALATLLESHGTPLEQGTSRYDAVVTRQALENSISRWTR